MLLPYFTEVDTETGRGKATQLVHVQTGAHNHLDDPPLCSEELRASCLLLNWGGNIDGASSALTPGTQAGHLSL